MRPSHAASRAFFAVAGSSLVVLGLIGAILPLLPSTIFFILAAACFARSSPRLEAWILEHRHFGPPVRAWRNEGAISVPAKGLALAGMTVGYIAFVVSVHPAAPLALAAGAAIAACALFVATRPVPR